jgi:ribosomal protein L12E/L44/L45/RPP1/RPP2
MVAATTRPDPTVGLIFYDLKHCLGSIEEAPAAEAPAGPAARRKAGEAAARPAARSTRRKADSSA